jgi:hypothetical protein
MNLIDNFFCPPPSSASTDSASCSPSTITIYSRPLIPAISMLPVNGSYRIIVPEKGFFFVGHEYPSQINRVNTTYAIRTINTECLTPE